MVAAAWAGLTWSDCGSSRGRTSWKKAAFDAVLFGAMFPALPSIVALSKDWRADRLVDELLYPIYLSHLRFL